MPTRTPYNFRALLNPSFRVPELSIEPGKNNPKPWLIFTTQQPSSLAITLERRFHARLNGWTVTFPEGKARLIVKPEEFDGHSRGTLFVFLGGPQHMLVAAQRAIAMARGQGLTVKTLIPKEAGP